MNKKTLALVLASTLSTGIAQAASITESFSIAPQTTDLTSVTGATGSTAIGTFNQFDSTLGTLTSVDISITAFAESSTVLENSAANAQTFKFEAGLDWLFEILDGDDSLDFAFSQTLFNTGFITMQPGDTLDLGTVNPSDVYSTSITGSELADFIGSGTVGIGCNTFSSTSFTGSTNITANQATTAGCSAQITYNYDQAPTNNVPAPAPLVLLGLGFGLFGTLRKSKKA